MRPGVLSASALIALPVLLLAAWWTELRCAVHVTGTVLLVLVSLRQFVRFRLGRSELWPLLAGMAAGMAWVLVADDNQIWPYCVAFGVSLATWPAAVRELATILRASPAEMEKLEAAFQIARRGDELGAVGLEATLEETRYRAEHEGAMGMPPRKIRWGTDAEYEFAPEELRVRGLRRAADTVGPQAAVLRIAGPPVLVALGLVVLDALDGRLGAAAVHGTMGGVLAVLAGLLVRWKNRVTARMILPDAFYIASYRTMRSDWVHRWLASSRLQQEVAIALRGRHGFSSLVEPPQTVDARDLDEQGIRGAMNEFALRTTKDGSWEASVTWLVNRSACVIIEAHDPTSSTEREMALALAAHPLTRIAIVATPESLQQALALRDKLADVGSGQETEARAERAPYPLLLCRRGNTDSDFRHGLVQFVSARLDVPPAVQRKRRRTWRTQRAAENLFGLSLLGAAILVALSFVSLW